MECIGIVILILVVSLFALVGSVVSKETARKKYAESLELLRAEPTSPRLRQESLALGRRYSRLTRNGQGVSLYDEMAIKNDIDAACAGAIREAEQAVGQGSSPHCSLADRLKNSKNFGMTD